MNNTLNRIAAFFFILCAAAFAQTNTIVQTSLSAAMASTDKFVTVASATGITAPNIQSNTPGSELYIVAPGATRGSVMLVTSVSGTTIGVRPTNGGSVTQSPSGSMVLVGNPNWFYNYDPSGGCTAANTFVTPWVNTKTGSEWLCSTVTLSWVPGFGNDVAPPVPTAAVASAAGLITPSGPLFHITGTSAITGFNIPVGFQSGGFCVIPDGIFTTTNANNIAIASTAVVSKTECWTYDSNSTKFYPAY